MVVKTFHIIIIFGLTLIIVMQNNMFRGFDDTAERMYTSWLFFSGLLDIFVAHMMFFTFVNGKVSPDIIRNENHKINYPVLDVIRQEQAQL